LNPFPSVFSTTSVKPALGLSFTYTSDVTLLLQRTGEVFDQDDRERKDGAGRSVVEVLKNKFGVSRIDPFSIHVEWWRMG
jgi:DNA repair protein RAD51